MKIIEVKNKKKSLIKTKQKNQKIKRKRNIHRV